MVTSVGWKETGWQPGHFWVRYTNWVQYTHAFQTLLRQNAWNMKDSPPNGNARPWARIAEPSEPRCCSGIFACSRILATRTLNGTITIRDKKALGERGHPWHH